MSERAQLADRAVHPRLASVFRSMDAAGVRWCILRGEASLDEPGDDVDLLVAPDDAGAARNVFVAEGFRALSEPALGTHRFFLTYDEKTDRWIKLDVVHDLAFGQRRALDTGAALKFVRRAVRVGPVRIPNEDDAFWALLLHCVLDKKVIAPERRRRLRELAVHAKEDGPLIRMLVEVLPSSWPPRRVIACAMRGDWKLLLQFGVELEASWTQRRRAKVLVRTVKQVSARRLRSAGNALWRRGAMVALVGPDGAGKTTVAEDVGERFYFPAEVVYMGFRNSPPAANIRGIGLARRLALQWSRYAKAQYYLRRGRLVVFDRYTFDAFAQWPRDLPALRRISRWLTGHAVPKPDRVVILDASPEALYSRKRELDHDELARQRARYRELAPKLAAAFVDTSDDPSAARRRTTSLAWDTFGKKARGR